MREWFGFFDASVNGTYMGDSSPSVHFYVLILWHSTDGKFVVLQYFFKPYLSYQIHKFLIVKYKKKWNENGFIIFSRDIWFKPPQNGMSRWGLAKIINRYIIQAPIIIFLVIYSPTLVSCHLNIFHNSKYPIVCSKIKILHFGLLFFLSQHFCHICHAILSGTIYCQKREHSNAGFGGIPARYPILRMSVSARLRGR